jgi:RNA polymerase sigma-70 factor, ECF subfamily
VATVPSVGRADASPAVAVSRLYESYYDRVYGYCLRCLGSREEAEDAAQSTFLYALRGLERGIVPNDEANWLFAIAKNVCFARHRTRGRRRDRECLSDPVALADIHAAPEPAAEELVGIEDALACLPEQQRRAILLREWRGLSYREIATELGLSGSAVETLIFRARRALAAQLGGKAAPARSRALRALDLGSVAAGLKSLLTGGGAAKLAAVAAAVATAGVVAGDAAQPGQLASRAPRQVSAEPAEHVQLAARAGVQTTRAQTAEASASTVVPKGRPQEGAPGSSDEEPTAQEPDLGSITAPVEDVAGAAGIDVDLPSAPDVPELPLPELPLPEVQLPETPEAGVSDTGLPLP